MFLEVQALEVISVNIWSILISLLNLLILFWLFKKFLFAPVNRVLQKRRDEVDAIYDEAKSAKTAAEAEKTLYDEKLASAKEEAGVILMNARERADRMSEEIVTQAGAKADEMVRKAEEGIALEKKKAMTELKNDVSAFSLALAEKIVEREISADDNDRLIREFIENVEKKDE